MESNNFSPDANRFRRQPPLKKFLPATSRFSNPAADFWKKAYLKLLHDKQTEAKKHLTTINFLYNQREKTFEENNLELQDGKQILRSELSRKQVIIEEKDKEIALIKIQLEEKKFECDLEKKQVLLLSKDNEALRFELSKKKEIIELNKIQKRTENREKDNRIAELETQVVLESTQAKLQKNNLKCHEQHYEFLKEKDTQLLSLKIQLIKEKEEKCTRINALMEELTKSDNSELQISKLRKSCIKFKSRCLEYESQELLLNMKIGILEKLVSLTNKEKLLCFFNEKDLLKKQLKDIEDVMNDKSKFTFDFENVVNEEEVKIEYFPENLEICKNPNSEILTIKKEHLEKL